MSEITKESIEKDEVKYKERMNMLFWMSVLGSAGSAYLGLRYFLLGQIHPGVSQIMIVAMFWMLYSAHKGWGKALLSWGKSILKWGELNKQLGELFEKAEKITKEKNIKK